MYIEADHDREFFDNLEKKLKKFCQKAPVPLSFTREGTHLKLKNMATDEEKDFSINLFWKEEQNIQHVKMYLLEHWYPVIIEEKVTEESLTSEEVNDLLNRGYSLDDALLEKKVIDDSILWRIEKVVLKKDQIILRNLSTMESYARQMKMPVTVYLKRMRESKYSPGEDFQVLMEKSELLYKIENDRLLIETNQEKV